MSEEWVAWHPKVGDIKPEKYRFRSRSVDNRHDWTDGTNGGKCIDAAEFTYNEYQIPAPVVSPAADRPPWIDPQCKFHWGDRVKCKYGTVRFVIHPRDPAPDLGPRRVIAAASLSAAVPYATYKELQENGVWYSDRTLGALVEEDLTLFPEDLPQHFDDRILDADQPQEALLKQPARVPREIWVNEYGGQQMYAYETKHQADMWADEASRIACTHFREVLPDDLTNIQYSPGG